MEESMSPIRLLATIAVLLLLAGAEPLTAADLGTIDQNGCRHLVPAQPGLTVTWSGPCVNSLAEGIGTQTWFKDGVETSRYEGPMKGGARHGKGVFSWKSGNRYEGDFVDNKRTGKGVFTWKSGGRYQGDFVNGSRTGQGLYVSKAGNRKEGEFLDGAYVPDLGLKFHKTVSGKAMTQSRYKKKDSIKFGMVNNKLKFIVPPVFADLNPYIEGLAPARFKDKWGFLDIKGNYAVPPSFDYAGNFSEGLASVCVGDRWGYINPKGDWVIPPEFEYGESFSEGLAVVRRDRKFGFIKKDGTFAVAPRFPDAAEFSEGLAAVKVGTKWGFIDKSGNMIIKPTLANKPGRFKSGVVIFTTYSSSGPGKCVMDKSGNIIIDSRKNTDWVASDRRLIADEFTHDGLARFIQYKDPQTGQGLKNPTNNCINPRGEVVDCVGITNGLPDFFGYLPLKVIREGRTYFLVDDTGKKILDLTSLEQQVPWTKGVRTIPEFKYFGGGVVYYEEARKNNIAFFVDGNWVAPAPDLNSIFPMRFYEKCQNAAVYKTDENGRCLIYNRDGKFERVPVDQLVPDLVNRIQYYESAAAGSKTPASPSSVSGEKPLAAAQPKAWDWRYAYGHPGGQDGKRYLFSVNNAEVVFEDPVYYWKPSLGDVRQGGRPGEIVYRFSWERPLADARLYIYLPTFHWAYSKGHNKLFGSRNGTDWIELLNVEPPKFGGVNNGIYDQHLPERLLGGKELWLKVQLDAYGPQAHQYPVAANTAQLNRYQKGSTADTFRLEVNFAMSTNLAFPADQGGAKTPKPKGRVLE
jgi:hypothetical protein